MTLVARGSCFARSDRTKSGRREFDQAYHQSAEVIMKVLASVKRLCRNCKIIKRKGVVRVICVDPRHKQRQG